ncbi:unnamed protein product [Auanema sp. JU1783]|nr:unnamed protein product [Auanema sp. JU1783]
MNEIYGYGSLMNNPLYNCSAMSVEDRLESKIIRRPFWGACSFVYGILAQFFYVLCLSVMRKKPLYQYACYKIMFVLGCVDMVSVFINNFIMAYCLGFGVDFCDMPHFLFVTGSFHLTTWVISCYFCLFLALNRILEVLEVNQKFIDFFYTNNIQKMTVIGFLYGLFFFLFTKPFVYSNRVASCLIDPQIYRNKSEWYRNDWLVFDDFIVVVVTSSVYGTYLVILCKRYKVISNKTVQAESTVSQRRLQKVFAQATVLCGLNFFCAAIYPAFMFMPTLTFIPKTVMMAYQFATVGVRDYFFRIIGKQPKDSHFTMTLTQTAMTSHVSPMTQS